MVSIYPAACNVDFWLRLQPKLEGHIAPSGLQSLSGGHSFKKSLEGVQLTSSLASLTFGEEFDENPDGIHLLSMACRVLMFGLLLRPEIGGHPAAQQLAKVDVWILVPAEL